LNCGLKNSSMILQSRKGKNHVHAKCLVANVLIWGCV
jgi:hypothetical protein